MKKTELAKAKQAATKRVASRPTSFIAESGPGARQPVLKLPSTLPSGARIRNHPLLHLMSIHIGLDPANRNKSSIAAALGVTPQSLYKWERACRADRNFPLPVLRAQQLATLFKVPPAIFRPDFPWAQ